MLVSSLISRAAVAPPFPASSMPDAPTPTESGAPLGPAVRIDIRAEDPARSAARPDGDAAKVAPQTEDTPRIFIDTATKAVVYQVLNPASGDVVFQLPDPVVLKARGYEAAQARNAEAATPALDRKA